MIAAGNGHPECAEVLAPLEKGMKNCDGRTALMCAAQYGCAECVRVLIEAEQGMRDIAGRTALYYTVCGNSDAHEECYRLLSEVEAERQTADCDALQEIRKA